MLIAPQALPDAGSSFRSAIRGRLIALLKELHSNQETTGAIDISLLTGRNLKFLRVLDRAD